MAIFTKTLKVRVRDKHSNALCRQGVAVNRVWNYVPLLPGTISTRSVLDAGWSTLRTLMAYK